VEKGIDAGRRPERVGGGLIRSVGGWKVAKTRLKGKARIRSDEHYSRLHRLIAQGVDLESAGRLSLSK